MLQRKSRRPEIESLEFRRLLASDLSVGISSLPFTSDAGRYIAFDVRVTNKADQVASARLETPQLELEDVRWLGGWNAASAALGQPVQSGTGPLAVALEVPSLETVEFRVAGRVPHARAWSVTAIVSASPDVPDVSPSDNTASASSDIRHRTLALPVTVEAPDGPFQAGERVSYTFHVSNTGSPAANVLVSDAPTNLLNDVTWTREENTYVRDIYLAGDDDPDPYWWWEQSSILNGGNGFVFEGDFRSRQPEGLGYFVTADIDGGHDVNADGMPDVVVGELGGAHVIFGGVQPHIGRVRGHELAGELSLAITGFRSQRTNAAVSFLQDINGDGIDDVMLVDGDSEDDPRYYAYVLFGGPGFHQKEIDVRELDPGDGFEIEIIPSLVPADLVQSAAVSSAGDLNLDGFNDFVIGLGRHSNERSRAYVIFGGKNIGASDSLRLGQLDGTNGFEIAGGGDAAWFAHALAGGADVNGDGNDDLVVSAAGAVYIIFGHERIGASGSINLGALETSQGLRLTTGGRPASIDISGDVDGDGINDLLLGVPPIRFDPNDPNPQYFSYVVFGGDSLNSVGALDLKNLEPDEGFQISGRFSGHSVAVADMNGDGMDDIVVGAMSYPLVRDRFERSHANIQVLFGNRRREYGPIAWADLDGYNGFSIRTLMNTSSIAITSAGDFNGDGSADLAFDVSHATGGLSNPWAPGETYFFFGRQPISNEGEGDIADILKIPEYTGVTYTVSGTVRQDVSHVRPTPSASHPVDLMLSAQGTPKESKPGQSLSYTFQVANGSVAPAQDVIVQDEFAANLEDVTWERKGGVIPRSRELFRLTEQEAMAINAATAEVLFGESRDGFDFNGDGWLDTFELRRPLTTDETIITLHFGSESGRPSGNSVTMRPEYTGGFPDVIGVGDTNGDGFDDFVVNRPGFQSGKGGVHVVFGRQDFADFQTLEFDDLDGTFGYTLVGSLRSPWTSDGGVFYGDNIGRRVMPARDVNQDGLADFIVWATPCSPQECEDTGIPAYLIYGAESGASGVGPIHEEISLSGASQATYTVSGSVPRNAAETVSGLLQVHSDRHVDPNPPNNVVEVSVSIPLAADLDSNGMVDIQDFMILRSNFGSENNVTSADGDLDGDGRVHFSDFLILHSYFGSS